MNMGHAVPSAARGGERRNMRSLCKTRLVLLDREKVTVLTAASFFSSCFFPFQTFQNLVLGKPVW